MKFIHTSAVHLRKRRMMRLMKSDKKHVTDEQSVEDPVAAGFGDTTKKTADVVNQSA